MGIGLSLDEHRQLQEVPQRGLDVIDLQLGDDARADLVSEPNGDVDAPRLRVPPRDREALAVARPDCGSDFPQGPKQCLLEVLLLEGRTVADLDLRGGVVNGQANTLIDLSLG